MFFFYHYKISQLSATVDFVNLHSYELFNSGTTEHSACIETYNYLSITVMLDTLKPQGIDISKLNIGIPFFGVGFKLQDSTKHGLLESVVADSKYKLPYSQVSYNIFIYVFIYF